MSRKRPVSRIPLTSLAWSRIRSGSGTSPTKLTATLSSPEDVIEFLQAFMPGMFARKPSLANFRNQHGPMRNFVIDMINAGLIKHGWFTDTLTKEGQELLEFVRLHQRELESQMRKLLRQVPVPDAKYLVVRNTHLKSRQKHYTYTSKTITPLKDAWLSSIAIPETIVQATKNRYFQKRSTPLLTKEDIRVRQQVMSKPIDVCLVIDGSASMAGSKMKAVWQLAEHLLLTTRDRIAVVIFQHRKARVVIPFTRNYTRLKLNLRSSMHPGGQTPLADGIVSALKLIKNRHVHNPLMILITDGVPTFGKWTDDPRSDALRAAGMVPSSRAKLICIGVESNQEFLKELGKAGQGQHLHRGEPGGANHPDRDRAPGKKVPKRLRDFPLPASLFPASDFLFPGFERQRPGAAVQSRPTGPRHQPG